MNKKERDKLLKEIMEDTFTEVESDIREVANLLDDRKVTLKVGNNKDKVKRNKVELAIDLFRALADSKEQFLIFKEILEINKQTQEISANLELELKKLEMYGRAYAEKSQRLKELLEIYREQVDKIMKIINVLPDDTPESATKKLEYIDRANTLLSEITKLILKFITL